MVTAVYGSDGLHAEKRQINETAEPRSRTDPFTETRRIRDYRTFTHLWFKFNAYVRQMLRKEDFSGTEYIFIRSKM